MIRVGKSENEFQDVYRKFSGNIHRMIRGMTGNDAIAEELTQEAFIKAWKGLPQFGLRSSLKTWIYQVALNVGRDWLRTHKNVSPINTEVELQRSQNEKLLSEALLEMNEDHRELLILFYYEGLKIDEMATILKVPEGTVKSRLFHSKKKLKELLIGKGIDV